MSREIRFRAWDKEFKEMNKSSFGGNYISFAGVIHAGSIKKEWILMQFTGLKDIDGKRIYESDICSLNGGAPLKVVWGNSRWEFATLDDRDAESFSGFADEYKVIGNIYENPELMRGYSK